MATNLDSTASYGKRIDIDNIRKLHDNRCVETPIIQRRP